MVRRERSLLDEIEDYALADPPKVAAALRRCIALGGRAGSTELRQWAAQELNGYENENSVPPYRIVAAPILIDGQAGNNLISGENVQYSALPEVVREVVAEDIHLTMGVAEIEAMSKSGDRTHLRLGLPQAPTIAAIMTQELGAYRAVHQVYWSVAKSRLSGVLDGVATRIVELVAEIRAGLPDDKEDPSAQLAAEALQVAVHGKGHRIAIQSPSSQAGPITSSLHQDVAADQGWAEWSWARRIGVVAVGVATVAGAVFAGVQVL